jgi:aldehyde:ferredoxin oxidoreductase
MYKSFSDINPARQGKGIAMFGYAGKFLQVDLASAIFSIFEVGRELLQNFPGGSSLAAKFFLDRHNIHAAPLSAENPLMIMTGPMAASGFPGSSRFTVCARSPQTNIWGESSCGGTFGPELRRAGYDGVVFTGKSVRPVYLSIIEGTAELRDAAGLWGKDIYETTDMLKRAVPDSKVLAIGPAGENLVRYASIGNDKAHYIGRTGMGAVMGSKNLKAVIARGSGRIEKYDEQAFKEAHRSALKEIKESNLANSLRSMGSDAGMDLGMMTGDVPIKNWMVGEDFELSSNLGGPTMTEKYLVRPHACSNCPIACKRVVRVEGGEFATVEGAGPEYETCCTFGTMLMNSDLGGVIKANELCNRYGMDTISCGATIAMAMELYEKGIIDRQDAGGLELGWGRIDEVLKLLPMIAGRSGIGNILAEGCLHAARHFGEGAIEAAVHVKGLELPMHDPRGFHGMGLAYMMSNRGACHLQHMVMATEQGMASWPQLFDMEDSYTGPSGEGKARLVFNSENYGVLANSLCMCHYVAYTISPEHVRDAFNAVTGFGMSFADLLKCGMREWTLKRGINNLLGVRAVDDVLPKRVLTPLAEGAAAGSVPDMEALKAEYYAIRGLNEDGLPRRDLLTELGLEDLGRRLYES